jgi:hypothetical protein
LDPLLTPTLTDLPPPTGPKPWRLPSLYLTAFFGGGLAAAFIAAINARRLGMPKGTSSRLVMRGLGFAAIWTVAISVMMLYQRSLDPDDLLAVQLARTSRRLLTPLLSVGFAWLLVRQQIRFDRVYQLASQPSDEYASLWGPGLLAVIAALPVYLMLLVPTLYLLMGWPRA